MVKGDKELRIAEACQLREDIGLSSTPTTYCCLKLGSSSSDRQTTNSPLLRRRYYRQQGNSTPIGGKARYWASDEFETPETTLDTQLPRLIKNYDVRRRQEVALHESD